VADATRPIVLAVDDEPGILDAVRLELEDDFHILTATGGTQAMELIAHRHVDVILLDLRMPDMTGEDVLRRLSAGRARPPVIVMSAVREIATVVECVKLGATDYVTKPWESGEFGATIRRSLRGANGAPGVLLVSDDPAALVPLQLAVDSHVRVATTSIEAATASHFPALLLVLHAPNSSSLAALAGLPARFPGATVVWVSEDRSVSPELLALPNRLDLLLGRVQEALGNRVILPTELPRAVMASVQLMVNHCRDPLTLDEIAARVGVSEDHLSRLFRHTFGLPAAPYYTRLRIAVACRLLKDTNEKMDDVAHQVGYSGAAKLSRAFKEVMGIRPGKFRRSPL
jgi:DNA-binding response OmpR family regulator/AraC-like DNA-binding protein